MEPILTITADQFLKYGISGARDTTAGGIFWQAEGVNAFGKPGVLYHFGSLSGIGTGVVVDTINYLIPTSGSGNYIFGYGNGGHIYRIDTFYDSVEDLTTVTAAGSKGVGFGSLGSDIYYSTSQYLGKMSNIEDASPTFNDTFGTFNNATVHPLHEFGGYLYAGDGNEIAFTDGSTFTTSALVLPSGYNIVDLDDDGYYLVIAARKSSGDLNRIVNKIFFWNTGGKSWQREYLLPGKLTAIYRYPEGGLVAFHRQAVSRFSFSTSPFPIIRAGKESVYSIKFADLVPSEGGVNVWRNNIIWKGDNKFLTFGRVLDGLPEIITAPIGINNGKAIYIADGVSEYIYLSTTTPKLFSSAGLSNTVATIRTNNIDLKRPYLIKKIKLRTGTTFSSSTPVPSITVVLNNDSGDSKSLSFSYNKYGTDKIEFWSSDFSLLASYLFIEIDLYNWAEFKSLEIYGEPISRTTTI